jgi:hypothetical protein
MCHTAVYYHIYFTFFEVDWEVAFTLPVTFLSHISVLYGSFKLKFCLYYTVQGGTQCDKIRANK